MKEKAIQRKKEYIPIIILLASVLLSSFLIMKGLIKSDIENKIIVVKILESSYAVSGEKKVRCKICTVL
jgi:hypothetical protein